MVGSTIDTILALFKYAIIVWLVAMAIMVVRDVFFSGRALEGILATTRGAAPNPERLLLLGLTVGYALYYSIDTLSKPLADLEVTIENAAPGEVYYALPDIPPEILLALAGAHTSYIVGKILRRDVFRRLIKMIGEQ